MWHSEQRLRLLLEAVTDYAIFLLDPDGRVVSWNQGAERIKGWRREEMLGEHLSRFYLPEEVAAGKPARELQVAAREGRVEDEGWRLRKDGSRFWADVVITAVHDEAGVLHGFAKVTRDLSERDCWRPSSASRPLWSSGCSTCRADPAPGQGAHASRAWEAL